MFIRASRRRDVRLQLSVDTSVFRVLLEINRPDGVHVASNPIAAKNMYIWRRQRVVVCTNSHIWRRKSATQCSIYNVGLFENKLKEGIVGVSISVFLAFLINDEDMSLSRNSCACPQPGGTSIKMEYKIQWRNWLVKGPGPGS